MTLDSEYVRAVVRTALDEDFADGPDATTLATVHRDVTAKAVLRPRADGVLAGLGFVTEVFDEILGSEYEIRAKHADGDAVRAGEAVLTVWAPARGLLMAERTALNMVCHLSGIASATAAWVRAVRDADCRVRDSRKTLPGLRTAQKYAVRCGGGLNHRMNLGDAVLIKDNHIAATGSVAAAIRACREYAPLLPLEVEVSTLDELDAALAEGPELVLLDNFSPQGCARAVARVRTTRPDTWVEASGTLTLDRAADYAETGVDYLAVGGLTHSAAALDIGLDM